MTVGEVPHQGQKSRARKAGYSTKLKGLCPQAAARSPCDMEQKALVSPQPGQGSPVNPLNQQMVLPGKSEVRRIALSRRVVPTNADGHQRRTITAIAGNHSPIRCQQTPMIIPRV
jgi:hypothetical protein